MKKPMSSFLLSLFFLSLLASCAGGGNSNEYDKLVVEYKKVLCTTIHDTEAEMSDKTKALQRQQELNKEFEVAYEKLSQEDAAQLQMKLANVMAEVSDGKCD